MPACAGMTALYFSRPFSVVCFPFSVFRPEDLAATYSPRT